MSTIIQGNAAAITTGTLTATVTAITNNGSGAPRVQTSAPHLFGDNDIVLTNAGPISASCCRTCWNWCTLSRG